MLNKSRTVALGFVSDVNKVLTLVACGCVCLMVSTWASADFVGVVTENKTDLDTQTLCGEADPPLTVCNVYVQFSDDDDRLLSVGFADVQVLGAPGALFHQHPSGGNLP